MLSLLRLLKLLKKPKPRRLKDRRKDDKGIEQRAVANGHEPTERPPGASVTGRRFFNDRRRASKFAIDKRKAIDRGKTALKIAVPAVATSVAAGAYNRKKKKKKEKTFDQKLESTYQEFKGSKLKRVQ